MKVVIAGTGYVGLTTGAALAYLGHQVTCLDVDERKIEMLRRGEVPIYEPGLDDLLALAEENIRFVLGYEDAGIPEADVIFIGVGTPSREDGGPNLEYVQQAAQAIGQNMGRGFTVIVNKSTVPIGSGNWVGALVSDAYEAKNGHKPGDVFAVASNPEFLREGSAIYDSLYPDRIVVGAENPRAIDTLTNLYRPILNQDFPSPEFLPRPEGFRAVPLVTADLASAELIKYAANAFLALKISYINEIALLAEKVGADITQIARGIGLDTRIGPRFLNAGIGWGGSCFGKDTSALISTAGEYGLRMPIVDAAREVNYQQRKWAVDKLLHELKLLKGRTVALLGLAFKAHTDDLRDAPALDIAHYLVQHGMKVKLHDPVALERAKVLYPDNEASYCEDIFEAVQDVDAIILVTEWPEYRKLDWDKIKGLVRRPLILDGRNYLSPIDLQESGFRYVGVGR